MAIAGCLGELTQQGWIVYRQQLAIGGFDVQREVDRIPGDGIERGEMPSVSARLTGFAAFSG